jgi:hypothetical protein
VLDGAGGAKFLIREMLRWIEKALLQGIGSARRAI